MLDLRLLRPRIAAAVIAAGAIAAPALAQTVGARIPVGANPVSLAVNPVTNKVYVANADADSVTVINMSTGATKTIMVGDYPAWVAINSETNTIYVSTLTGANTTVIYGDPDTPITTTASGGGGWTAVNPLNNTAYVVRYGGGDEVNVIEGSVYHLTSATRSFQPVGIAVNPVNNHMFVADRATTDIAAVDMTTPVFYPPLLCPDGSGGFRPQPPDPPTGAPDPYSLACIDIPGTPVAVAINPVTNKIYGLSEGAANQISVISGVNHTFTSLTPASAPGTARTIAVNPLTNKIYAVFSGSVVVIDGATNAMTQIPAGSVGGGPVAIGINVLTNMVYVPQADSSLLIINGATNATSTVAINPGANAIAVNPLSNTIFVLDSLGGVTPVAGAASSATSTGITTTITPLAGNSGGTSGTITLNATSAMTPAPLNSVRRVYFRIDGAGSWTEATGTGPYPAAYSDLAPGPHTIEAFATNGLEAPSINTDLANVPVVGNVASYGFTVSGATNPDPARLANLSTRMQVLTGNDVMIGGFVIDGAASKTVAIVATGPSLAQYGIANPLANPTLTLVRSSDQAVIASNDDWQSASNAAQIQSAGFAPSNSLESAILATLPPGAYTAIVAGANGGTGVGVVAVYEVDRPDVPLINIATRGKVLTGNDVMIGGFVIQGSGPQTVAIVGTGPSLAQYGIANPLANPTLTLVRSSDQSVIASNDDWQSASNASAIQASGFAPSNPLESAILVTLQPGAYTAILSGVNGGTGTGIVAVYATQ